MTMAGRKPTPTAQKLLHGNPGKRPLNLNEPKFTGVAECPAWLTPSAKRVWANAIHQMAELDMIKNVDSLTLAAMCQSYANWEIAEKQCQKDGLTVKEPILNKAKRVIGYKIKRHPASIIAKDEKMAMAKLGGLFGFDPSSRSRIQVPDSKKEPTKDDSLDYLGLDGPVPSTDPSTKVH